MRSRPSVSRIARLPDILVNQIAAGEVVERPASVVKELVENSLDARASRVDILLEGGGIESIQILDDGHGMDRADLELSLERHTTSKIREATDLEAIATFGFRGEALASIASVSELEIVSRTESATSAHRLAVQYGVITEPLRPVAAPVGTSITVRRLFERLPARQKYLRSAGTELSHCGRLVKEMAMAAPEARFYLRHQGRLLAEYIAPGRAARFEEAFRVSWKPLVIHEEADGLALELYLSPPALAQDRGELYLFVNGRAVRNRSLLAAVRNAYLQTLGPHHEPSGAVYLDLRPEWVDVNVHPQKMEVRCLKQETIYPWILSSVRKAVARLAPAPTPPIAVAAAPLSPETIADERVAEPVVRYLGRFQSTYLVCELDDGLIVIDSHALHEKARKEKLKRTVSEVPRTHTLALPRVLRLPISLSRALDDSLATFAAAGLEIEPFGDGDIAVKTIPEWLPESEIDSILIDSLTRAETTGADRLDSLLDAVAARAVRDAGVVAEPETRTLLAALSPAELSPEGQEWICAHGHPLWFRIPSGTIEKHFRRSERNLT